MTYYPNRFRAYLLTTNVICPYLGFGIVSFMKDAIAFLSKPESIKHKLIAI